MFPFINLLDLIPPSERVIHSLKTTAIRLHALGAFTSAEPFLALPLLAGDAECQFLKADILQPRHSDPDHQTPYQQMLQLLFNPKKPVPFTSPATLPPATLHPQIQKEIEQQRQKESQEYQAVIQLYTLAAEQGHLDSMIRLKSNGTWREKARTQLENGIKSGNAESLFDMYGLTLDSQWLTKSAFSGYAPGQYLLAHLMLMQQQFPFLKPTTVTAQDLELPSPASMPTMDPVNQALIDSLLKDSAEAGYPPAMKAYAERPINRHDFAARQKWCIKRAAAGDINGVAYYGLALAGAFSAEHENDAQNGFAANYVKGYALIWLVSQIPGREDSYDLADKLKHLENELSAAQIEAGQRQAQEWQKAHPLLSEFRPKYSVF